MEVARRYLSVPEEESEKVSRIVVPPRKAGDYPSFYENFSLRGLQIHRAEPGLIVSTFKVPPRLTDRSGNLATGAIANLVDEIGYAAVYVEGAPMSVSVNMSISYLAPVKAHVYHVDLRRAAWFSASPWSVMAFVGYLPSMWSDYLIQRGTTITLTRKIMQSFGVSGPEIALVGLTTAKRPSVASAWLTMAIGLNSFGHSGFLVNIQKITPEYSGVLHGISNTAGTVAAIMGMVGTGFFLELVGSFQVFLMLTSLLYVLAAMIWYIFSSVERKFFYEADS